MAAVSPPAQGYAAVYFPGTTVGSNATRIALGVSEEKSGIDIALQMVPFSTINGYVSGVSPLPAGLSVYLTEVGPLSVLGGRSARVDPEGRFAFSGIPPGQYQVTVRSAMRPAVAAVPVAQTVARIEAAPAQWLWAQADLAVAGQPRTDISLSLTPGMSVSGTVAFRGSALPAPSLTGVRLSFLPLSPSPGAAEMELASASARVDDQGRFTAVGLMPGRYRITASGAGAWTLSSVVAQGRDVLDFPLEIRPGEDVSGIAATFGDRATTVGGALQDVSGQPAAGYTVIIFADDNRYWTPMSRRVQATRPATDGRFSFRSLPPGEYRIAAVVDPEPGQWFDPEFLRQLVVASTTLRIAEGETKTQDLRVAR
jgi:protocatechuate 3,4-dioxygenase beta subunit